MSHLSSASSAIASTTTSQPPSSPKSSTTRESLTRDSARSAELSLRAQTVTSWCSSAQRASPVAIAPVPTIPRL